MNDEHMRRPAKHRDMCEIRLRIEPSVTAHDRRDDQRCHPGAKQSKTVWSGPRYSLRADKPRAASSIVDEEFAVEAFAQNIGKSP
jgi:hypothetical protein